MTMVMALYPSSALLLPTTQKPTNSTTPNKLLGNSKTPKELKQLHCQMMKKGLSGDLDKLIAACVQMGTHDSLDYARNVFKEQHHCSLYTCNSLIRAHASAGLGEQAILLYIHMVVMAILPDKYTFPFLLSACSKIMAFSEGVQVHGVIVKMGLDKDIFVANSLIHFYAECGKVDLGRKVFDAMLERNVVSWTTLINGYAGGDMAKEAVFLFFAMVEAGVQPNQVTMVCAISACANLKDLQLGKEVCALITERGVKLNALLLNALLDMYMKCGDMHIARGIFDGCNDKNLVMYNTIMSNYVHHGLVGEVQ